MTSYLDISGAKKRNETSLSTLYLDCKMNQIIPGVFVGDALSAKSNTVITRVVNAGQLKNLAGTPSTDYLRIEIDDTGSHQDLLAFNDAIPSFLTFMDKTDPKERPVLIHCQLGVSRSCSLMVVYLLAKKVCATVEEAIDYVRMKRSVAFINRQHVYRDVIEDWFSNFQLTFL